MAQKLKKGRRPQKATSTTPTSSKWTPRAVHHLRTQLALTQEDFAETLGTTRQTIINWEQGHQVPKKMASRLLSALEQQVERGEWWSGEEGEAALDPRLTKLVLQTEDPEATARALLQIARRRRKA